MFFSFACFRISSDSTCWRLSWIIFLFNFFSSVSILYGKLTV